MGLKNIKYNECLLDSPDFRDTIREHEKELEQNNDDIKSLIQECKNLIKAEESRFNLNILVIILVSCCYF